MSLSRNNLKTQNTEALTPEVQAEDIEALNVSIIDSAVNLQDDGDILGGGHAYNPSRVYGAEVICSFDDGNGKKLYESNKTTSGTFTPADWDIIDTTGVETSYDATIFVDDAGDDLNTGRNQNNPVKTATKGIELANALIAGGATSVCVLVYSGDHTISGITGYESGITVQGIGFPKISFGTNAPLNYGGTFNLTLNGIEVTGFGGNILNSNTFGEAATVFNINLVGCKLSWSQAAETNGLIGIFDDSTVHTLNLKASFCSGDLLKIVTQNANFNFSSCGNVIDYYLYLEQEGLGTTTYTPIFTGSEFKDFVLYKSTIASSPYDATIVATFNGLSVPNQSGGVISLGNTSASSSLTIKTVGSSYFESCPIEFFITGATGSVTYEGSGVVKCSDGDAYNPANKSGGFMDYNDASTAITPVTLLANTWTDIPNDGLGAFTNKTYKPSGITELLDGSTGYIDPTELPLGSDLIIRKDFTITPNTNNTGVHFRYVLGTGVNEYTLETNIPRLDNGAGEGYRVSLGVDYIYMGDANTRDNPIKLQIKTDADATLINAGIVIKVTK